MRYNFKLADNTLSDSNSDDFENDVTNNTTIPRTKNWYRQCSTYAADPMEPPIVDLNGKPVDSRAKGRMAWRRGGMNAPVTPAYISSADAARRVILDPKYEISPKYTSKSYGITKEFLSENVAAMVHRKVVDDPRDQGPPTERTANTINECIQGFFDADPRRRNGWSLTVGRPPKPNLSRKMVHVGEPIGRLHRKPRDDRMDSHEDGTGEDVEKP